MIIQNVAFQGISKVEPKTSKQAKSVSFNTKPDSFEHSEYDRQAFQAQLESYHDKKGKPVYNQINIAKIIANVEKDPKRYVPIKEMAALPNMSCKDLTIMSMAKADSLAITNEFSKKTKPNGTPKYASNHLTKFAFTPAEELERLRPLTDTSLHVDKIFEFAEDKTLDLKKLSKNVLAMEEACGKKTLEKVSLDRDIYDPKNAYLLTGSMTDGTEKSELLDKKLNRLAISETSQYKSKNGKRYIITKTNDLRNNTVSKVRSYIDNQGYPIVENQVRIIKDEKGKVQRTEYMTPSEVKGVFNSQNVYPNGKVEQVSSGKIDKKTGIISVKRDMKSLDGTRTQYLYENDPQGNRIIDYKITDKNGKQLLNYSQSLEVIDDNKFITSKNDKSYEVTVSKDKKTMTVKDMNTNEENSLNLGKMLRGDKASMVNLLKKFPGEELIALKDTTNILKGMRKMDDCCYWSDKKEIDVVDDLYSVLHELGHAKDFKYGDHDITADKEVQKVYNQERKAFNKAFPNAQRDYINYFIDITEHYSGEDGGLEETVAESNALLNSYNGELDIAARAQYLQQYFPKTIATLANRLQNA